MTLTRLQRRFFSMTEDIPQLLAGYDCLSDVFFFVKDIESRIIFANSAVLQRLGLSSADKISGTCDQDFFPEALAACFRRDDLRVFTSGKPLVHRLESWYDELHELKWFVTTKLPLRNKSGQIIGLMGIMRRDAKGHGTTISSIAKIVDFVCDHATEDLSNSVLAQSFALSERTLHRKLQETLGVSPHELVIRTRVQKAAEELINTDLQIAKIAATFHFCDQSAFTQIFKKHTGMTPLQFRNKKRMQV